MPLVSTRSLGIRDLEETVEKDEVASVLCLALGRPVLDGFCRLFTRFGKVRSSSGGLRAASASTGKSPDAMAMGSCPIFREELRGLRGRN